MKKMATDLAKYLYQQLSVLLFYDRNTDKVLDHWDNPKYIKSEE